MPILFEWYKYVATLCVTIASITQVSPAIKIVPNLHYAILTGLLNRCARLMLSNMRLSSINKYGDTTTLLDRCICESAVTVQWLCANNSNDCFEQFLADGVKNDLRLKDHIEQSISSRGGQALVIEERMLSSIEKCVNSTNLSEAQIRKMKRLPNLESMCHDVGLSAKYYIGTQRMGSHQVHGTWTSLWAHYLRQAPDGTFELRDHDVSPYEDQFMIIPIIILETLAKYWTYIIPNTENREPVTSILRKAKNNVLNLSHEVVGSDFDIA
ncbi:MAG: DUF5677 domain-containing protein [Chloroflexi bacterium]|nr:DUF5677 domain-containing protein [Chloroflexota bacterium]